MGNIFRPNSKRVTSIFLTLVEWEAVSPIEYKKRQAPKPVNNTDAFGSSVTSNEMYLHLIVTALRRIHCADPWQCCWEQLSQQGSWCAAPACRVLLAQWTFPLLENLLAAPTTLPLNIGGDRAPGPPWDTTKKLCAYLSPSEASMVYMWCGGSKLHFL